MNHHTVRAMRALAIALTLVMSVCELPHVAVLAGHSLDGTTQAAALPAANTEEVFPNAANGQLAFVRFLGGNNNEIFVINANGSGPSNLTNNIANDFAPSWSPDGTKLAFATNRSGNFDIYVMNADGSSPINLTASSTANELFPAWSPDGAKLAFTSDRDSNDEIYTMNADGTNQTRLTNNAAFDRGPAWSPAGAQLAFTSNRDGSFDVYTMSAGGSNQTRLTNNGGNNTVPNWSPDGTKLAFSSDRDGNNEIYVINADGSNQIRLTNNTSYESDPVWSPDGSQLAFTSGRDGNNEIYTMNPDGTGQTNLTANPASDTGPAWQPVSAASTLQFSAATFSFSEGDNRATIIVTRAGDASVAASVEYRTIDDPAEVPCDPTSRQPDGTPYPQGVAYARCDYATSIDTISFAANERQKSLLIPLIDDAHVESSETVRLSLSNPQGASLGATSTATLTITDNDAAGQPNPIFSTPLFVRMHYLDFLSREPEAGEPWSAILNGCPNPFNLDPQSASASCDRLQVSFSFFGSPEFRLKGFYVFTFYRVAFDRLAEYAEIVADMRAVTGQTPADTSARRAQFPVSFTQRAEFRNRFDTLSNEAFVNALLDRYGLQQLTTPDPANPEGGVKVALTRADLMNRLSSGLTRAQALRAIVESDEVSAAEHNRAFVAMQYYGYLRRTPDQGGYNDWLDAIGPRGESPRVMVNGFMNAPEYRLRFGNPNR